MSAARRPDLRLPLPLPLCAVIVLGFLALRAARSTSPRSTTTSPCGSRRTTRSTRPTSASAQEFGGQRTLHRRAAVDRLFTPERRCEFIRDGHRRHRARRHRRARAEPGDGEHRPQPAGRPERGRRRRHRSPAAARRRDRRRAAAGASASGPGRPAAARRPRVRDGTVTAIVVTFDEDRIDDVRGERHRADPRLDRSAAAAGHEAYYNGSLEISETYNRVTLANTRKLTPPILLADDRRDLRDVPVLADHRRC